MNNMPSAAILYISWAFVFLGPKLDRSGLAVPGVNKFNLTTIQKKILK